MSETRICLSTDVLIDFFLGKEPIIKKIKFYSNEQLYITSLTLFEIRSVAEKQEILSEFLNFVSVLNFDEQSGECAARILRKDMTQGINRSINTILTAAICISNNAFLFTKDRSSVEGIKELKLV